MAEVRQKEKDRGYQIALQGLRSAMSIGIIILIVIAMIFLAKKTYQIGYAVFDMTAVDPKGEGTEMVVIIEDDMSVSDIGKLLNKNGLLDDGSLVFWFQERLSDYHGKIVPGSYILNTSETVEEMLAIMTRENTEGQPDQGDDKTGENQTSGGQS